MDNGGRQLKERVAVMDFQPMSPEEMQRTMQFLLQQQARFEHSSSNCREKWTEWLTGWSG
jgi:hypothetical protein